jgi:CheY-like chemotaxis protein
MTRVLIVEDEPLVALDMESALLRAGFKIATCAGSLEQALAFLRDGDCDVGVLDANLRGESVAPVAIALKQRNRPFVFVTGYGRAYLPDQFLDAPLLAKPYKSPELVRIVREISAKTLSRS